MTVHEALAIARPTEGRARDDRLDRHFEAFFVASLRGVFQYGLLHFGHTRGSASSLGTHVCLQRSQEYPRSFSIAITTSMILLIAHSKARNPV